MTNNRIQAEGLNVAELLRRGTFVVPWHQRYFDWTRDEVDALLEDVLEAVQDKKECYFLGSIMLLDGGDNCWHINDGQQRLITLSLVYAALCRLFHQEGDAQREGASLRLLFVRSENEFSSLHDANSFEPRLAPPKLDEMNFNLLIRGHNVGTNGALTEAWKLIEAFFESMTPEQRREYFQFMLAGIEVAVIWVPSELDASAVFETLNCRGRQLQDIDRVRNFLYSHFAHEDEASRRATVHESLEHLRGLFSRPSKGQEYLRCHLQCRFGAIKKDHLYREFRSAFREESSKGNQPRRETTNQAFSLIELLTSRELIALYQTFTASNFDPDFLGKFLSDSRTSTARRTIKAFLRELKQYNVTSPLIFAILRTYVTSNTPEQQRQNSRLAHKALKKLSTFVVRTALVATKFEPSKFDTEFANYAKHIYSQNVIEDESFAEFLQDCDRKKGFHVLEDSVFRSHIEVVSMPHPASSRRIKLFMLGINEKIGAYMERLTRSNFPYCSTRYQPQPAGWEAQHQGAYRVVQDNSHPTTAYCDA